MSWETVDRLKLFGNNGLNTVTLVMHYEAEEGQRKDNDGIRTE
jgi:hypothetical protein